MQFFTPTNIKVFDTTIFDTCTRNHNNSCVSVCVQSFWNSNYPLPHNCKQCSSFKNRAEVARLVVFINPECQLSNPTLYSKLDANQEKTHTDRFYATRLFICNQASFRSPFLYGIMIYIQPDVTYTSIVS